MSLTLNTEQWTLQDLLERVIKKDMGFEEPSLSLGNDFIWEEGEDADTDTFARNLTKRLVDLPSGGITHGTVLTIEDFSQDLDVRVTFSHKATWESEDDTVVVTDEDYKFLLSGSTGSMTTTAPKPKEGDDAAEQVTQSGSSKAEQNDDDDDDVVIVSTRKRTSAEDGDGPARKKLKSAAIPEAAEVIDIDDD
jgi:ubiquitin-like 1-activating enzyme E1 B